MKPARLSGWATALTLASKDLKVALSYRLSFVFGHLGVVGGLVLFYFVSRVVGKSAIVGSPDEYFRFVVVGMAFGGLVEELVGASMGAARRDQVEGTLEAIASLPVSSASLGLGWVLYPLVNSMISLVATFVIALPLGMWGAHPNAPVATVALVLTLLVFVSLGFVGAAIVLAFQQGGGVIPLALALMALLSGVLFPVSVMPHWLEILSQASPLRHSLDAMRLSVLDDAGFGDVRNSLITLAVFAGVLVPVGVTSLELGLRRARRNGTLSRF